MSFFNGVISLAVYPSTVARMYQTPKDWRRPEPCEEYRQTARAR